MYSKPYNPVYKPGQKSAFKLSRSKIDLFLQCPRCFYLDRRLDIKRPSTPPFTLNSAVDGLLKNEFDSYRAKGEQHPIQKKYKLDVKAALHKNLDQWRENFVGIQYIHPATNFLVFGALDDLWINDAGEYIVVDYKATARSQPVTKLGDAHYHDGYRRQIEVYQWLLRQNGLKVSNTGYWLYATGKKNEPAFEGRLEFEQRLISYEGNDNWIEKTLKDIKDCLESEKVPEVGNICEYCPYARSRTEMTLSHIKKRAS